MQRCIVGRTGTQEEPHLAQLTEQQQGIYHFIREKVEARGYGPPIREIGESFEIYSPNAVMATDVLVVP